MSDVCHQSSSEEVSFSLQKKKAYGGHWEYNDK